LTAETWQWKQEQYVPGKDVGTSHEQGEWYEASACFAASVCAIAQDPAPAPIPLQITAGKRVFISNATGESNLPPDVGDTTYNQFYASLKSWGRYELVSTPADADLVFEIRYEILFGPVDVMGGSGGSAKFPQIRLSILDPKTHIIS
jgi:hypothetical protein